MIPAERSHLQIAATSHPGMSGKTNEDRYAVSAFRLSHENPLPVVFAVVSDGIGGHRAGEVAAEMTVELVSEIVANSDGTHPVETLREAIIHAGNKIYAESETDTDKKGMGATCACCWIIDDRLYTATVGDSRIYLVRGNSIQQLSKDHTWIQEAVDAGILKPEQTDGHPNAHIIRRYLGSKQPTEPDTRLHTQPDESDEQAEANQGMRLLPGDQVILCSDGLSDLVTAGEILGMINNQEQEKAVDELIALANKRGGHDNITIATIRTPVNNADIPKEAKKPKRQWNLKWTCLVASAAAIIGLALIIAASLAIINLSSPTATPTFIHETLLTQPAVASETPGVPTYYQENPTSLPTDKPLASPLSPSVTLTPQPTKLNTSLPGSQGSP